MHRKQYKPRLRVNSGHIIPVQAQALGQSINLHSALSLGYYCLNRHQVWCAYNPAKNKLRFILSLIVYQQNGSGPSLAVNGGSALITSMCLTRMYTPAHTQRHWRRSDVETTLLWRCVFTRVILRCSEAVLWKGIRCPDTITTKLKIVDNDIKIKFKHVYKPTYPISLKRAKKKSVGFWRSCWISELNGSYYWHNLSVMRAFKLIL